MLPLLLADLEPVHVVMAVILLLVIRPLSGWISLFRSGVAPWDRAVISVYGVRGIGSIYYLCYAGSHMEFINEASLWSLVGLVILLSTIIHGFSVGWAMDRLKND